MSRAPRAFRLDETAPGTEIQAAPDPFAAPDPEALDDAAAARGAARALGGRGVGWGSLLGGAVSGFILLWLTDAIVRYVADLLDTHPTLGVLALGLAGLAGVALLVLLARELLAIGRGRAIVALRDRAAGVLVSDEAKAGRAVIADLATLYRRRPDTAAARARLDGLRHEIIDGADLIRIAERELMGRLDGEARAAIAAAARRVSIVTAISPRAIIDLFFVGAQALRLIRAISEIYGGRPGFLGFVRLLRAVGAHLAVTGGMAMGDSLVQQILGHGIAARLSARLGEGVLNGLLTARVGLSAIAVCRPLPFEALPPPGIRDVAGFLLDRDRAKAAD